MFIKLCIDYLNNQVERSNMSKRDKASLKNFLRIINDKLSESREVVYNIDELQRAGG
ncbi:Uncharacterised protein [Streptococcus uberis]|uniref:hypothetical protein n=1 Tax=Streptococcus uberis TaxID=1349 RepID=UPI000DA2CBCB|nr:hypothetical protein [Streptococcus uberis]SQG83728.1 Uncharacterised protein [Streptococcus uberis]